MNDIYLALSGALAQEKRLEVITNNLANLNTRGFKKDYALFEGINPKPDESPMGQRPMFGVLSGIATDFSPGSMRTTGEPLDIAIEGDGFFEIQTPTGLRYTRNGHFTLNEEGQIVTPNGYPVMGSGGPILIPPGTVSVGTDGKVSVQGTEVNAVPVELDTFRISVFANPSHLKKTGGVMFEATDEQPNPSLTPQVRQGMLEESNVQAVEEMVNMIAVMRQYEAAQKAIQTADQAEGHAANDVGRLV